ncbi:Hypothetical protein ORPV_777 [Orpheovirus IHUMI-LCC2]|uniref:MORN-repeat protein n=1 Tax=Orpheovirus IHUMI-LCC2 TaxID=2023057 RepID=A0A2I2L588_9VIRU|nr:Hypothetical protein ORPV_777 [Orpheovirus IHUMI-LCC2]SNW62681.1 Hypothetical protein ORPV_777 [Orpheovirus IHUMI-LCC2]
MDMQNLTIQRLEELPNDIIFHYLLDENIYTHGTLACVCKRFNSLSKRISNPVDHFLQPMTENVVNVYDQDYYINKKTGKWEGKCVAVYVNSGNKGVCKYKDGERNGIYTLVDKNGKTLIKGKYINGKKEGKFIEHKDPYFIPNEGAHLKFDVIRYKNGIANGKCYCYKYDEYGDKIITDVYRKLDGKLEGKYRKYYDNGNKKEIIKYSNNKINGKKRTYHHNGIRRSTTIYYYDKKHGKYVKYGKKGNIVKEGRYFDGNKDGRWITYHTNANGIKSIYKYKNGIKHGIYTTYYPSLVEGNGNLRRKGKYKNGIKHGKDIKFYNITKEGKPMKKEVRNRQEYTFSYIKYDINGNEIEKREYNM